MPLPYLAILILLASAILIYLACEWFVNGVEWLGVRLAMGQQATGTVLAAFGTALPESVVTLVAVAGGGAAAGQLGIGAALGGPLALATIAYATVGLTMLAAGKEIPAGVAAKDECRRLRRDQGWFLLLFALKILLGVLAFAGKYWMALPFLAAYALYLRQEMRGEAGEAEGELEPLKLRPRFARPPLFWVVAQTGVALVVIYVASRLFVGQLGVIAPALGLPPQLAALLLSPLATELPETMNAVIWVRQGKYRLALANISGAMMVQATVPTALGLWFTPWLLDRALLIGAGVTAAAILTMWLAFAQGAISRRLLAAMGGYYLLFVLLVALG